MKTAIIHDWLVTYAGAERALEQIIAIFPESDLYSLVDFLPDHERTFLAQKKAGTSFIQALPFAKKKYRSYLPFMPLAIEQFDLSAYDLIISSSHAVAKGVLTNSNQLHVCYCYTPMRYAWDLHHQYLREAGLNSGLKGMLAKLVLHYMRIWDYASSNRVDHFAAISQYIAGRIRKIYGRNATVIYPPVDIETFIPCSQKDEFYLTASRMVPYKKVDLIVEAFSQMPEKRLIVIGDGPDLKKVKSKAASNIELIGYQPTSVLKDYLQKAKAFVYAAEEDFGILPVEAQACGTPVIAYGKGGILETVIPLRIIPDSDIRGRALCKTQGEKQSAPTGVFFHEQTVSSLLSAVSEFEAVSNSFNSLAIRRNAERFSKDRFKKEFKGFIDKSISERS